MLAHPLKLGFFQSVCMFRPDRYMFRLSFRTSLGMCVRLHGDFIHTRRAVQSLEHLRSVRRFVGVAAECAKVEFNERPAAAGRIVERSNTCPFHYRMVTQYLPLQSL